jgi:ubiquinone/menaquinone biosynthesis C-methylase UbiE
MSPIQDTAAISDSSTVASESDTAVGGAGQSSIATATMDCDWIARFYRAGEYLSFGGALQACRVKYLRDVADCRRALVCGDGDGRFLAELLQTNHEIRVDYVDLSDGMAGLTRRRVEEIGSDAAARVSFHTGDLRELNASEDGAYDLLTAHFFLDCFDEMEVASVARRLANFASPGATLLLSDFRIPLRGIARYIAAAIVRGLYVAFRISTGIRVTRLPNYEDALTRAGFRKQRETLKLGGLLVASLWRKTERQNN